MLEQSLLYLDCTNQDVQYLATKMPNITVECQWNSWSQWSACSCTYVHNIQRKENCLLTTGLCVADESHASRVQRIAKTIVSRFGLYKSGCTEGGHKDAKYYCRMSVEQLESMVNLFMHV